MTKRIPRRLAVTLVILGLSLGIPLGVSLASDRFADVPDSNPFHADIDALVVSGVTFGCGGGNYCPKQNVTREQMAAFMNRLGALGPGQIPKVNADKVDGFNSSDLVPGGDPPGGMTIRGTFAIVSTGLEWESHSFGYTLSRAPVPHYVAGGGPSSACPGNSTNPRAAVGTLCIYEDADLVSGNPSLDCVFAGYMSACGTAGPSGFVIAQNGDTGGWSVGGTWAVTEPMGAAAEAPIEQPGDGRSPFGP